MALFRFLKSRSYYRLLKCLFSELLNKSKELKLGNLGNSIMGQKIKGLGMIVF